MKGMELWVEGRDVLSEEKNSRAVRKKRTNQSSTAVIFSSFLARARPEKKIRELKLGEDCDGSKVKKEGIEFGSRQ